MIGRDGEGRVDEQYELDIKTSVADMLLNIKGNKWSWAARVMRVQEEISRGSIRVTE